MCSQRQPGNTLATAQVLFMTSNTEWDDNDFPLAYLITIRTFGTWLHGDERGSVDRHGKNIYGSARISANANLDSLMRDEMKCPPFLLDALQRRAVENEIGNVCTKPKTVA